MSFQPKRNWCRLDNLFNAWKYLFKMLVSTEEYLQYFSQLCIPRVLVLSCNSLYKAEFDKEIREKQL